LEREVGRQTKALLEAKEAIEREMESHKRTEQELRLLLTIEEGIGGASDFLSALKVALEAICEATPWDFGEIWVPAMEEKVLECSSVWWARSEKLKRFRQFRENLKFPFGHGLPGRVAAAAKPEWVNEISALPASPRSDRAREAGFGAALGVPITAGERVIAVFVFFLAGASDEDHRLSSVISTVAARLGALFERKIMDQAFKESQARLQAVMDNSPNVIYIKDLGGRYLHINRRFEKLFQAAREKILGSTDHDIFPREVAEVLRANDVQVLRQRSAIEFEEIVRQDDVPHTYLSCKFPLYDSAGIPYGVCGISTDISERKQLEERLLSSKEVLENEVKKRTADLLEANKALQVANAGKEQAINELRQEKEFSTNLLETAQVVVLFLNTQARVVYFNPYMEQLSGYTLEEARDKDWLAMFIPQRDQMRIRELFDAAIKGRAVSGSINPIVTKDGREREIEWSASILKEENGDLVGLLCTGVDITERNKAESWFRSLIEADQDAVVSIDHQGRIDLFNPAAERVFGYSKAEIKGQKVNVLMAEPYASEHDGYIDRYERTGEAHAIGRIRTVAARRKSGEIFPIELSVTQVAQMGEVRYAALIRDISDKAKLQQQLVETERLAAVGTTAAKLAHEIASPLNGMYVTIQLLERQLRQKGAADVAVSSSLKKLADEIKRLNHLLHDFSDLSKRERYSFAPVHIAELATEVLEMEASVYRELDVRVEQNVSQDLPAILGDRDRLKQALLNLCKNAFESMGRGGVLTLRGEILNGELVLEVADTGIGVPDGVDIFEPFMTTKSQGTGLGLMVVRQIVAAHGGRVSYSSHPGAGTTFRLYLPLTTSGA
jgi:PAS domain S-box-containing protein